jgi:hypothetical protein
MTSFLTPTRFSFWTENFIFVSISSNYCGFWPSGQNGQNLRIFSENLVWSESKRTKRDFWTVISAQNMVSLTGPNGISFQKCTLGQRPQYLKRTGNSFELSVYGHSLQFIGSQKIGRLFADYMDYRPSEYRA